MSLLISTQNIQKTYGMTPLFSDISLGIFADERLGLIGPNGSGKSTLLKILMGLEAPDNGKIISNSNIHLAYLPQEDQFAPEQTLQEILFANLSVKLTEEESQYRIWEVTGEKIFDNLSQKVAILSGGWRKRLAIVQALLLKPDLLLMDEPTNHLDLEGVLWLEQLLKKTSFAFVLITHDRYFLENTVNAILELNKIYPEGYFKIKGNYSNFLQRREEFISSQINKEKSLTNKMRREQEWLQRGAKARTTKAQYRIDKAAELQSDLKKINISNTSNKMASIDFSATHRKTQILLETHDLTISRNNSLLFKNLNLKLSPGYCLGLMGRNGSGKSTLMGLLNATISPDSGYVKRADNLRIVTFEQKRQQLDQNQTLKQALSPSGDSVFYQGNTIHVAAWAKRFLFPADQLQQSVAKLSGGEQARVVIANLMLQAADILLLDEPTNDLDIPTLEVLEESLQEFPGAIVLITHDRFLLDRLSDQLLYLDGNGKAEFFADYAQWLEVIGKKFMAEGRAVDNQAKNKKVKKLNYDEQRELNKLPAKIQKLETEMALLQTQLANSHIINNPKNLADLCTQIQTIKTKIDELYLRWEELEQLNTG